jgi:IS5 family transposase
MPHQLSFSQVESANKRKVTRWERFLAEMEQVVPWEELLEAVLPVYYQ